MTGSLSTTALLTEVKSGVGSYFRIIRCRFIFSGKNDELTPDFFDTGFLRAVDQPHPPVPDRRSHLAAPPETGNQRPRLAGPLPIPGHPGRRPPARRSEVHRGQPGAGRDGGRPVRVYLVEPPLPWRRACRPILDSFPEWEQLGRTEPERQSVSVERQSVSVRHLLKWRTDTDYLP